MSGKKISSGGKEKVGKKEKDKYGIWEIN